MEQDDPYAAPRAEVVVPAPKLDLASRLDRLWAALLDVLVYVPSVIPVVVALIVLGRSERDEPGWPESLLFLVAVLMYLATFALQLLQLHRSGQTFGKRALGIKIVRGDGTRASFWRIFLLRILLTSFLGGLVFCFSWIDVLFIFREDRRCIHDLIADTTVVIA
jgi:uncharacterized RDD family membrane protein YckC